MTGSRKQLTWSLIFLIFFGFCQILFAGVLNDPHSTHLNGKNVYYSSFATQPKTLDPARSYSSDEWLFIAQIYEPPLQYQYLVRPYTLEPVVVKDIPVPQYFDKENNPLGADPDEKQIAYTLYRLQVKPGIRYAPHPAFAKDEAGHYRYHHLTEDEVEDIHELRDFKYLGSRELVAEDFVYQIKRIGDPRSASPIYGMMSNHIAGMTDFNKTIQAVVKKDGQHHFIDLRQYPLSGARVIDRYTYEIKLNGKYPQILYWLAMPFFAPVPWEADLFYAQPGMDDSNITFDWYPIGTGPFMLTVNNPNRQMVMARNPNFHNERFPTEGEPGDKAAGLLQNAGQKLPFLDFAIFSLEKESIPRWSKFLQGYYDISGITSDSFDQAIIVSGNGDPSLSEEMKEKGIRLQTTVGASTFYMGFNMLDKVVGGYSNKSRKLRQAISIAINFEEYISIFLNGRGIPAQGPIPPGIFGYQDGKKGINSYVYEWSNHQPKRLSLTYARQLIAEAGYPGGIDPKTKKPLILNYDVPGTSAPDDKATFEWLRKQFGKLGIELNIRATQYNRFQKKMRKGDAQIFMWGWHADYPDPENFFFLLYGPNGKVQYGGENAVNYNNPTYNKLFEKMKSMSNSPERLKIIEKMLVLLRKDSPWDWGFHPLNYQLVNQWMSPSKPNEVANNTLKYAKLDAQLREECQEKWNQPILWPLFVILGIVLALIVPVVWKFWRKEYGV